MRRTIVWFETVSRMLARIAGMLVLLSAVLISLDVVWRAAFRSTIFESFELSSYAFAIATTFGLAWALVSKAHIRIEVIYSLFGTRSRAWLDAIALGVLALVASIAAYWCAQIVLDNMKMGARSNSTLAVPLAWPQSLWWLGLAWFAVCAFVLFVVALQGVLTRRHAAVHELFGLASVQQEIGASLADGAATASAPDATASRGA